MHRSNIVELKGRTTMDQSRVINQPNLVIQIRDKAKEHLANALRQLFNNADDALFEMADKAGSNGDQTRFLDAMRELRLNKKQIATSVLHGAIKSYTDFEANQVESGLLESESSLDELGLIDKDDLELKVAIEGMASRIRSDVGADMEDLRRRYEALGSRRDLPVEAIPASPEKLCDLFVDSMESMEISIQARLVILKLFEKHVLSQMVAVYTQTNDLLKKGGVLPDLNVKQAAPKNRSGVTNNQVTTKDRAMERERNEGQGDDQIPTLTVSFANSDKADIQQSTDIHSLMSQSRGASEENLPVLSLAHYENRELVDGLSSFQNEQLADLANRDTCQVIDFRKILDTRLGKNKETSATFSELDDDVINLVSMLFEFILDDRQLQPAMKALVARLQIPILKVALLDKSFFSKGGHPARQLLNMIASSAIGWTEAPEGRVDHLKNKIEYVVDVVLKEFDDDVTVFEHLYEDFKIFVDKEDRRRMLIERRISDAEQGKAENERAQSTVRAVISKSVAGKALPECADALINDGLSTLMVLHFLKGGEKSPAWEQSCHLLTDFVSTFSPDSNDANARTKLLSMIPRVMGRVKQALKEASFDEFKASELIKQIESEHIRVLSNLQPVEVSVPKATQSVTQDAPELSSVSKVATQEVMQEETQEEAQQEIQEVQDVQDLAQAAEASTESKAPSVEDVFLQQVDKLAPGGWFEIMQGDTKERCKLAAIVKIADKHVFVNRSGIKIAEKSRVELASGLQSGSIQMLNDGLLFDRALESVITDLRSKART